MNVEDDIKEKQKLSDLTLEFYKTRRLPDNRFFLTAARRTVVKVLADATETKVAKMFLRLHYPFFDDEVQKLLLERFPESGAQFPDLVTWYAVEAYLIAEQYALTYYGDDSRGSLDLIEWAAQFYFVFDLPWFARLLLALTKVYEQFANCTLASAPTHVARLQLWNNHNSEEEATHQEWLEGTEYLQTKNKNKIKIKNSIRVSAAKENRKRRKIFLRWRHCWEAELKNLNLQLRVYPEEQQGRQLIG